MQAKMELIAKLSKSIESINKHDFYELGAMKAPSKAIVTIMEAVCILLGLKDKDWTTAKKNLLCNPSNFMANLKNYDKDNLPLKLWKKIRPYA